MAKHFSYIRAPSARQRGASLLIGLIMLLVLTLLGIAAISNVTIQERMAGGLADRNLAFQAAEMALRRGEEYVKDVANATADAKNGSPFYDLNTTEPVQPDPYSITDWNSDYFSSPAINGITNAPRYRIERQVKVSDAHPTTYRITAIGYGNRPGSTVVLQTTFGIASF